jgi:hypothetical protein
MLRIRWSLTDLILLWASPLYGFSPLAISAGILMFGFFKVPKRIVDGRAHPELSVKAEVTNVDANSMVIVIAPDQTHSGAGCLYTFAQQTQPREEIEDFIEGPEAK